MQMSEKILGRMRARTRTRTRIRGMDILPGKDGRRVVLHAANAGCCSTEGCLHVSQDTLRGGNAAAGLHHLPFLDGELCCALLVLWGLPFHQHLPGL